MRLSKSIVEHSIESYIEHNFRLHSGPWAVGANNFRKGCWFILDKLHSMGVFEWVTEV